MKGEVVEYQLGLTNEFFIPTCRITASFHIGRSELGMETRTLQLGARKSLQIQYDVRCPYRGVYTVGLSQLIVWDIFGWAAFTFPVFNRTFYVYPRIIQLQRAFLGYGSVKTAAQSPKWGTEADWTLYRELRPYQHDDDIRHVSWQKMALFGEPLVREYDTSAQQAVIICLDMRQVPALMEDAALDIEDSSIEITVSLLKYYLDHQVPAVLTADGRTMYFSPGDEAGFTQFLKSTIMLFFHSSVSPVRYYEMLRREARLSSGSVIFVTHLLDAEILELVQNSDGRYLHAAAVVLTQGLSREEQRRMQVLQHALTGHPGTLITANSAEDVRRDLGT